MPRGKQNKRGFQAGNTQNKKSSRVRRTCDRHLPAVSSAAEGKIHRVDPDFGSTFSVSNRGSQSNCWVNWKTMGQPCGFQVWVRPCNLAPSNCLAAWESGERGRQSGNHQGPKHIAGKVTGPGPGTASRPDPASAPAVWHLHARGARSARSLPGRRGATEAGATRRQRPRRRSGTRPCPPQSGT